MPVLELPPASCNGAPAASHAPLALSAVAQPRVSLACPPPTVAMCAHALALHSYTRTSPALPPTAPSAWLAATASTDPSSLSADPARLSPLPSFPGVPSMGEPRGVQNGVLTVASASRQTSHPYVGTLVQDVSRLK